MKKYLTSLFFFPLILGKLHGQTDLSKPKDVLTILKHPLSFNDLIKQFKGKVIYIDFMASWCKPCIQELKSSKGLDEFFTNEDIVKLYISIDNFGETDKALEVLKTENATGYFVTYQAPDGKPNQFATDLENLFLFDSKKQFRGIPIYAIVDKQGTLITNDAIRPSSGEKLKYQLKQVNVVNN
ncbi:MAG: redoxin family protein [Sphingobacterium sp.]|jgi:thiol-disulfide isomerase/thioredoxin|uniref:TlpA family protein disulfide reductase n=1 Tax=Sphingobacterium sp. TaxID=341027 RepID=UPI002842C5B4|nr:redoxin family protein [Sphingobacterium sp.]MDR3006911.1 redoxin family protein [Sphingobacterium sp.]